MENYEFLLLKINELERKNFELEARIKKLEEKSNTIIKITSKDNDNLVETNTRTERYMFNGNIYKKSKLVLAVIKYYIELNSNITLDELSKEFPSYEFKSSYQCVMDINLIPDKQKEPVKRFFIDDPIILRDGTNVAVCTQWGQNINLFIAYVTKKYGFVIEPVK